MKPILQATRQPNTDANALQFREGGCSDTVAFFVKGLHLVRDEPEANGAGKTGRGRTANSLCVDFGNQTADRNSAPRRRIA